MAQQATAAAACTKNKSTNKATTTNKPTTNLAAAPVSNSNVAPGGAWQRGREANGAPVCWVEVFVGGTEAGQSGRWVHVDPLYGWVDRPQGVEEAHARGQPLSYVVACMEGGVKDVTKRYCGDVRATQRLRDESWWQETLAPLRGRAGAVPVGERAGRRAVAGNGHVDRKWDATDGGFVKQVRAGCVVVGLSGVGFILW